MAALWYCVRSGWLSAVLRTNRSMTSYSKFAASTRHWIISIDRKWYSSNSSEENNTLKKDTRDEPIRFSTSKAKGQTLDDTLGAQKSDSPFPFYLGVGVLALIMYFAFIRNEDPSESERWDILKMKPQDLLEETTKDITAAEKESPLR